MASNGSGVADASLTTSGFDSTIHGFGVNDIPDGDINYLPQYDRLSLLSYSSGAAALLTAGYMVIFVLAVVSNGAVIAVIWRSPGMRNVTSYLLANLAAADIAVAVFVMPITLLSTLFTGILRSALYLFAKALIHSAESEAGLIGF
jgi:hypothetical protein